MPAMPAAVREKGEKREPGPFIPCPTLCFPPPSSDTQLRGRLGWAAFGQDRVEVRVHPVSRVPFLAGWPLLGQKTS